MTATQSSWTVRSLVIWSSIDAVVTLGVGLGSLVIIGALVGPHAFGLATSCLAISIIVSTVAAFGLGDAVINSKSFSENLESSAATFVTILSLIGAVTIVALAVLGFSPSPGEDASLLFAACGVIVFLDGLCVIPTAILTRDMKARSLTQRLLLGKLFYLIALTTGGALGLGAWAVILAGISQSLINVISLFLTLKRWPKLQFEFAPLRPALLFGMSTGLDTLVWTIGNRVFLVIFGSFYGPAALGNLQFAWRLAEELARLLQSMASRYGLSYLSEVHRVGGDVAKAAVAGTRMITILGLPAFAGLAVTAPMAIELFFAGEWGGASAFIQILSVAWMFAIPRTMLMPALRAKGRTWIATYISIVNATVLVLVSAIIGSIDANISVSIILLKEFVALSLAAFAFRSIAAEDIYNYRRWLLHSFGLSVVMYFVLSALLGVLHSVFPLWSTLVALIFVGGAMWAIYTLFFGRDVVQVIRNSARR